MGIHWVCRGFRFCWPRGTDNEQSVQLLNCVWFFLTHGLQHTRLPCPSLSPAVCSNSYPLSWWCCLAISSSAALCSSFLQSFPASRSFPMSQLSASGSQSTGTSASVSVLLMNIQVLISFRTDWNIYFKILWSSITRGKSLCLWKYTLFHTRVPNLREEKGIK